MKFNLLSTLIFILNIQICFSQSPASYFTDEDVMSVQLRDYEGMKEGEKYKWTSSDGSKCGIKFENEEKSTWIEHQGEMVRHGLNFIYDVYKYGGANTTFLKERNNYLYGKKEGESKIYFLYKGEPYLKEKINYVNGLKHGSYIKYNFKGNPYITGTYKNAREEGVWRQYYSSGSLEYEVIYDGLNAKRIQYADDVVAANHNKKGKFQSESHLKYFEDTNNKGAWKLHGAYNWYNLDGEIIQTKYFIEGAKSNASNFATINENDKNEEPNINLLSIEQTKELFHLIFGKAHPNLLKDLGSITKKDRKKAFEYLNHILKQTCGMRYFESIMKQVVTPANRRWESIDDIFGAIALGAVSCDKNKKVQGVVTVLANNFKTEFTYRLDYGSWAVD